jgi:hypothetical protein
MERLVPQVWENKKRPAVSSLKWAWYPIMRSVGSLRKEVLSGHTKPHMEHVLNDVESTVFTGVTSSQLHSVPPCILYYRTRSPSMDGALTVLIGRQRAPFNDLQFFKLL